MDIEFSNMNMFNCPNVHIYNNCFEFTNNMQFDELNSILECDCNTAYNTVQADLTNETSYYPTANDTSLDCIFVENFNTYQTTSKTNYTIMQPDTINNEKAGHLDVDSSNFLVENSFLFASSSTSPPSSSSSSSSLSSPSSPSSSSSSTFFSSNSMPVDQTVFVKMQNGEPCVNLFISNRNQSSFTNFNFNHVADAKSECKPITKVSICNESSENRTKTTTTSPIKLETYAKNESDCNTWLDEIEFEPDTTPTGSSSSLSSSCSSESSFSSIETTFQSDRAVRKKTTTDPMIKKLNNLLTFPTRLIPNQFESVDLIENGQDLTSEIQKYFNDKDNAGDRPRNFKCSFKGCQKTYLKSSHLKQHFRSHTGQ
jgi:hypothetical protein